MRLIKTYNFLIVCVVAIVGLILGGVFDYQAALGLHNGTSLQGLGMAVSNYCFLIFYFIVSAVAGVGFFSCLHKKNAIRIPFIIVVAAIMGFSTYQAFKELRDLDPYYGKLISIITAVLLLAICLGVGFFLGYRISLKHDREKLFRLTVLFACIALSLSIFNIALKYIWSRPRPLTMFYGIDTFRDFWIITPFEAFKHSPKNLYTSFPSNHTALTLLALPALLIYTKIDKRLDNDKARTIIFYGCFALGLLTGFTRMLADKHYLSDVSFGLLSAFLFSYIGFYAADRLEKKQKIFCLDKE